MYGECDNFAMLMGHTNAITDMHFSTDGSALYTASADKTVMCWDTTSGTRVKKLKGMLQEIGMVDGWGWVDRVCE